MTSTGDHLWPPRRGRLERWRRAPSAFAIMCGSFPLWRAGSPGPMDWTNAPHDASIQQWTRPRLLRGSGPYGEGRAVEHLGGYDIVKDIARVGALVADGSVKSGAVVAQSRLVVVVGTPVADVVAVVGTPVWFPRRPGPPRPSRRAAS